MDNTLGINIIPDNDSQRVAALDRYELFHSRPEAAYDHIVGLAAKIFQVPIALISFVHTDEVFFKAKYGIPYIDSTPRENSICSLAIARQQPLIIQDALEEPAFRDLDIVQGPIKMRFYAGVPIYNTEGFPLGTICLLDQQPRQFTAAESAILQDLALLVQHENEARLHQLQHKKKQAKFRGQLAESEIRFQSLIEKAPIAIAVYQGLSFKVLQANEMMLQMWNKNIDEVIGKPLLTFRPEMHGHPYLNVLHQVFTSGNAHTGYEIKGPVMAEGQPDNYYDVMYQPLKDDLGQVTGVMGMLIDVTENRIARQREQDLNEELISANEELYALNEELTHTNQEKKKAEELLLVALATADIGTWHIDLENRRMTASPRMKELYGYDTQQTISESDIIERIDPAYREYVTNAAIASVRTGIPYRVQYPVTTLNEHKTRWLLAVGRLFKDPDQHAIHFSGVTMDITEQKQDEIRKNDFIGMVSHELKTPLTSLKGYIQVLHQKAIKRDDAYSSSALSKVEKQILKMQTLINGFLNLSGLESGKIRLNIKEFDLCDLILETIEDVKSGTNSPHQFIHESTEGPMLVRADKDKIGQVLYNFMSNTIKYAPNSHRVEISCHKNGEHIEVSVKDYGNGIREADLERVFDRYFRVENVHTQLISGFGIGLYLSKEIIQRHHGKIWVESKSGVGTTFSFKLPLSGS